MVSQILKKLGDSDEKQRLSSEVILKRESFVNEYQRVTEKLMKNIETGKDPSIDMLILSDKDVLMHIKRK